MHSHPLDHFWWCCQCQNGPIGFWQPSCVQCSPIRCLGCTVQEVEIPVVDIAAAPAGRSAAGTSAPPISTLSTTSATSASATHPSAVARNLWKIRSSRDASGIGGGVSTARKSAAVPGNTPSVASSSSTRTSNSSRLQTASSSSWISHQSDTGTDFSGASTDNAATKTRKIVNADPVQREACIAETARIICYYLPLDALSDPKDRTKLGARLPYLLRSFAVKIIVSPQPTSEEYHWYSRLILEYSS